MNPRPRPRPRPKVLLVGPTPPPSGGVAVHLSSLRSALRDSGARCEIFDPARPQERGAPGRAIDTWRTLGRHARDGWIVHVHTNGHNRRSWLLALLAGIAAGPNRATILTLHSGLLPDYLEEGSLRPLLARVVCAAYRRVVVVNPALRDSLLQAGVAPERLIVTPACTSMPGEPAPIATGIEEWLAGRRPVLASVLAFRPEYRFGWQLSGLRALLSRHPDACLVVIGSGEPGHEAHRLVQHHDLGNHVLLLGEVDHPECLAILSRCDVFLRTTTHDGDALSVREAVALGLKVVASDVGTRPDGVHRFPVGDFDGFVRTLREALASEAPPPAATDRVATEERRGLEALQGLYHELAAANTSRRPPLSSEISSRRGAAQRGTP